METILDRFLRYIAVDTMSDEESASQPSAQRELTLSRMLVQELGAFCRHHALQHYFKDVM